MPSLTVEGATVNDGVIELSVISIIGLLPKTVPVILPERTYKLNDSVPSVVKSLVTVNGIDPALEVIVNVPLNEAVEKSAVVSVPLPPPVSSSV